MTPPMLEMTFRRGRPFAAYLHLGPTGTKAKRTRKLAPSLIGDFDKNGELLGLEILAFDRGTVARINPILEAHGRAALPAKELAPLRAA